MKIIFGVIATTTLLATLLTTTYNSHGGSGGIAHALKLREDEVGAKDDDLAQTETES